MSSSVIPTLPAETVMTVGSATASPCESCMYWARVTSFEVRVMLASIGCDRCVAVDDLNIPTTHEDVNC